MLFTVIIIIIIIIIFSSFAACTVQGSERQPVPWEGGGGGGESLFNWYYTLRKIYLFGFWFQFLQVDDTHQNYNVQIF